MTRILRMIADLITIFYIDFKLIYQFKLFKLYAFFVSQLYFSNIMLNLEPACCRQARMTRILRMIADLIYNFLLEFFLTYYFKLVPCQKQIRTNRFHPCYPRSLFFYDLRTVRCSIRFS